MALISETRKQSSQDRQPLLPPPPPPAQSSLLPLLSSDTTDLIDWNDVKGDVYINDYDHEDDDEEDERELLGLQFLEDDPIGFGDEMQT